MRKQTHDGQVTCYVSSMVLPTPLDDYEFDQCGFLVIPSALSGRELGALNQAYDGFPTLGHSDRVGNAQRRACTADTGFELHNLLDCSDPALTDIGVGDGPTMIVPGGLTPAIVA